MTEENPVISNEVYPLPVLIYGRPGCENTAAARKWLDELRIPFVEVNIEEDEDAARYVEHINHGSLVTPTIVFGNEDFIIVEPSWDEMNRALLRAGYMR